MYDTFLYNSPTPSLSSTGPTYLIEYDPTPSEAPTLMSLLKRYVLRSKVRIQDVSEEWDVWAAWGSDSEGHKKPGGGIGGGAALSNQFGGLANGHGELKMAPYLTDALREWGSGCSFAKARRVSLSLGCLLHRAEIDIMQLPTLLHTIWLAMMHICCIGSCTVFPRVAWIFNPCTHFPLNQT